MQPRNQAFKIAIPNSKYWRALFPPPQNRNSRVARLLTLNLHKRAQDKLNINFDNGKRRPVLQQISYCIHLQCFYCNYKPALIVFFILCQCWLGAWLTMPKRILLSRKQAHRFKNRLHWSYFFQALIMITYCSIEQITQKSFHSYLGVVAFCSSLLQPDADLSYEVPSPVSSEASEGWSGAADTKGQRAESMSQTEEQRERRRRRECRCQWYKDLEEQQQREERAQVLHTCQVKVSD